MTMTRKSAWTIVGIVVVGVTAVLSAVIAFGWAAVKLWAWFQGPAPGL